MKDITKERDFERLVKEHKGTVYTVCYMFSNDREEVQDLYQDTLLNLWNGFDGFRGEAKADTWVWRVALNTCLTAERKKRRRGERVPLEMAGDLFTDTDTVSRQAQMLHERIHRLDMLDRALILLWLEDMSYEEIGAIVGISPKNVSVKLVRIKQQLINMSNTED